MREIKDDSNLPKVFRRLNSEILKNEMLNRKISPQYGTELETSSRKGEVESFNGSGSTRSHSPESSAAAHNLDTPQKSDEVSGEEDPAAIRLTTESLFEESARIVVSAIVDQILLQQQQQHKEEPAAPPPILVEPAIIPPVQQVLPASAPVQTQAQPKTKAHEVAVVVEKQAEEEEQDVHHEEDAGRECREMELVTAVPPPEQQQQQSGSGVFSDEVVDDEEAEAVGQEYSSECYSDSDFDDDFEDYWPSYEDWAGVIVQFMASDQKIRRNYRNHQREVRVLKYYAHAH